MFSLRTLAKLGTPLFFAVLVSCSPDAPTQPAQPAQRAQLPVASANASLVGGLLGTVTGTVTGTVNAIAPQLLSCPVRTSYTSTKIIGPAGGVLTVGPHSFVVPAGALASSVSITATAPAGNNVLVEFQPEGLRFAVPTALNLSYRDCGLLPSLLLRVAYVGDDGTLELLKSYNNSYTRTVTGQVEHFSTYAIAF